MDYYEEISSDESVDYDDISSEDIEIDPTKKYVENQEIWLGITEHNVRVTIHEGIACHLMKYQVDGVKHICNAFYKGPIQGSACVLAHSIGLGKTLQEIALLHTIVNTPLHTINHIVILCPKSAISSWKQEIDKWIGKLENTRRLKVFKFSDKMYAIIV